MYDPLLGRQLASYRLLQLLGKGGFANVYLGQHVHLGTHAAIKVLHAQLATQEEQEFRKEALLLVKLRNPHIVRMLDYGIIDNRPFLITELAEKGSLNKVYPHGTLMPLPEVVAYTLQIAEALRYAHSQNIVHRDVKPENILVGDNDELLLADFGIAKLLDTSGSYQTGHASGTLAYIAPEQIMGNPGPASDQYALGIMVYEWLTGRFPFQGTVAEIISSHMKASPPSMRTFNPQIRQEVEEAVQIALRKEPERRFRHVQAFADALSYAAHIDKQQVIHFKVPLKVRRQTTPGGDSIIDNSSSDKIPPLGHAVQSKPPLPFTTLPSLPQAQLTEFWWPTFVISTEQRRTINQGGLPSEHLNTLGQLPGFPSQPVPLPVSSSVSPPTTGNLNNIIRISDEIRPNTSSGGSSGGLQAGASSNVRGRTTGQQSVKRTTGTNANSPLVSSPVRKNRRTIRFWLLFFLILAIVIIAIILSRGSLKF